MIKHSLSKGYETFKLVVSDENLPVKEKVEHALISMEGAERIYSPPNPAAFAKVYIFRTI